MVFKKYGERYAERPGGYTRVLRIEPIKEDQAPSAILELVDGPRDIRFAMTAKTLASAPKDTMMNEVTASNVQKVTQFRKDGMDQLRAMIEKMRLQSKNDDGILPEKRKVYPEEKFKRQMHYL